MAKYYLLIVLMIALTGCHSQRIVNTARPSDLKKLPQEGNHDLIIFLANGQQIPAANVKINPDSTRFYNSTPGKFQTVKTTEIKGIAHIQRGRGAVEGLGGGLFVGSMLATGMATVGVVDLADDGDVGEFAGTMMYSSAAITGGMVEGTASGAARGHWTYYQFYHLSAIKLEMDMYDMIASGGVPLRQIIVGFVDENGRYLLLDESTVKINDAPMKLKIEPAKTYYAATENLLKSVDSIYTFHINLANSEDIIAHFKEPETYLRALDVPEIHSPNQPLTLNWLGVDSSSSLRIKIVRITKSGGRDQSYYTAYDVPNPAAGGFTLPTEFFSELPNVYRVKFIVTSVVEEPLEIDFSTESRIRWEFTVSKSVDIAPADDLGFSSSGNHSLQYNNQKNE